MAATGSGGQAPQPSARKAFPDECPGACRSSGQTGPNAKREDGGEQGPAATKEHDAADADLSLRLLDRLVLADFNHSVAARENFPEAFSERRFRRRWYQRRCNAAASRLPERF